MASKGAYILILEICAYITLKRKKRHLQDWLRILRWEDYPGLSGRPSSHKTPSKREAGIIRVRDRGLKMLCCWL